MVKTKNKSKRLKKFRKTKKGGSWLNSMFGIFKSKPVTNVTQPVTNVTPKPVTNVKQPVTNVKQPVPNVTPKPVTNVTPNPLVTSPPK